ncbi:MAG: hypothetical protein CMJ49_11845 [Planctomycetaceae bacterium]|nr:hypothetical protein [Planctomycetaceae bacterium]
MSFTIWISVIWQPFVTPVAIGVGAVVMIGLASWACRRAFDAAPVLSVAMLVMRLGLIVALAGLLMGPSARQAALDEAARPQLTIMVDTSASMQTEDMPRGSRIAWLARRWLSAERLAGWREDYDVRLVGFDASPRGLGDGVLQKGGDTIAGGSRSHIMRSVGQVLDQVDGPARGSAVLVLSDGRDTENASVQSAVSRARARGTPVHTAAFGGLSRRLDTALVAVPMQEVLFVDEPGAIHVQIIQAGLSRDAVILHVRGGDEPMDMPVRFDGSMGTTVEVPIQQSTSGLYEYTLSVDPLSGEVEATNNEQRVFVRVTDRRMRVLLVEGEPFWDTKFLAQALRGDPRVELTQISRITADRQQRIVTRGDGSAARLPDDREELSRFDAVILGRGIDRVVDAELAGLLRDYVEESGGSVIFARGRAYDPDTAVGAALAESLGAVEPVVWGSGRWHEPAVGLTAAGRVNPVFALSDGGQSADAIVAGLPRWDGLTRVTGVKPTAIVLARGDATTGDAPAMVTMAYGRGRTAVVLGEGIWRWEILDADHRALRGVFGRWWSNTVRWAVFGGDFAPGRDVTLRPSSRSVRLGDAAMFDVFSRLHVGEVEAMTLSITSPNGEVHQAALRQVDGDIHQRGMFEPRETGVHRVTLTGESEHVLMEDRFTVYQIDVERLQSSANPAVLRLLAEQTGGTFFGPDEAGAFEGALRREQAVRAGPAGLVFLWDRGWVMVVVLVWVGLEWMIRRLGGLL